MSYQIITDSCCDFSSQLYQQLNIRVVPLSVEYDGQVFDDRNDDSLKRFYAGLRSGKPAKTSAVNPDRWAQAMEEVLSQGQDVLVLTFSSGLSATCQSALIAAGELQEKYPQRKLLVCDTLSASMGQGLLVWHACRRRDAGMSLEEVHAWVEENKLHLCHWFTVDDLLYLKRGGRISGSAAIVGTMLQIKPVLHMDAQGHLTSRLKARGRKAALNALAQKYAQLREGFDNPVVFISHGDCPEDAEYLKQLLKETCGAGEVITGYVGSVVGAHSGPGTVALFFLGSQR